MGRGRALMEKSYRDEYKDVKRKGKKRSLWASVGMGIGGLIAVAATGGAATPLVAGLIAAGGTAAGGLAASYASKKGFAGMEKTELKGKGKWMKDTREDIVSDIHSQIGVGAVKAGLFAGYTQAGGMKGLTDKADTRSLGEKIFKRAPGSGQTEGFGKAFDFRGSTIGKGVTKMEAGFESRALGREFKDKGWIDPNLQTLEGGKPIVAMDRRLHREPLRVPTSGGPGIDETSAVFSDKNMWANTDPSISTDMSLRDLTTAKRSLMDARPVGRNQWGVGTSGSGMDFTATGAQPKVPVSADTTFSNPPIGDIIDPGFSTFNEASWREGSSKLYDVADKNISWKNRLFPSKGGSKLLRKPGGFDPRY